MTGAFFLLFLYRQIRCSRAGKRTFGPNSGLLEVNLSASNQYDQYSFNYGKFKHFLSELLNQQRSVKL